ncbi:hypothetical protein FACS189473_1370 [Spirochaetia bacterium]|nr:hypothetical protein FACS189473_1370 [Spirochaetia bacterium]
MKNRFPGTAPIFALSFIILITGFAANAGAQSRTPADWIPVTIANDLAGAWEGSISVPIPENPESFLPASSITITLTVDYTKNSDTVQSTMKIDMEAFLEDWHAVDIVQTAGLTKDSLWDTLVQEFSKADNLAIGGKYYLTVDLSDKAETFAAADAAGAFFKNQNHSAIKLVLNEPISFGLGDKGFTEITLTKRKR